jgi:MATE family multidrug resistance protein
MAVGLAGNVVNAVLAWALIHGRLGLPALGVSGAGYATALTEVGELVALLAILRARTASLPRPALGRAAALGDVLSLGSPTGIQLALEAAAFTVFTTLLGSMAAAEMAAHQIALALLRVAGLPGLAVAEAACVLVARALGRRRLDEADRVTRTSLGIGVGLMAVGGLVFALCGGALAAWFSDDARVVTVARRLLLLGGAFGALDAINVILRGALRGAKDVRWVMLVGTTLAWIAVPGSALVLGRIAGLGAVGAWVGFLIEAGLAGALFWRRWARGAWREAHVAASPLGAV